ncbi:MAG TPA: type II secretion system protein [Tepidisphaeraceae bacterium]|nr:type II secretion system protein [Tepidisphaeraceae bacterium]
MCKYARPRRLNGGFSMAELLVSIGIIALLVAILLPVLSHAQESARRTACLSNLRQLGAAYQLYVSSNGGQGIGYARHYEGVWFEALRAEYGNIDQVRVCPATAGAVSGDFGDASRSWTYDTNLHTVPERNIGSYGFNAWLIRWDPQSRGGEQYSGGPASSYFPANPAESNLVPLFGDCTWADAWARETDPTPPNLIDGDRSSQGHDAPNENMLGRFTITRHGRNINVAFVDGHAETVHLESLKHLKWHAGFVNQEWTPPLPAK